MSCEIIYLTGVVRGYEEGVDAMLDPRLHLSAVVEEQESVMGFIPPFELTPTVSEIIMITGKCRLA